MHRNAKQIQFKLEIKYCNILSFRPDKLTLPTALSDSIYSPEIYFPKLIETSSYRRSYNCITAFGRLTNNQPKYLPISKNDNTHQQVPFESLPSNSISLQFSQTVRVSQFSELAQLQRKLWTSMVILFVFVNSAETCLLITFSFADLLVIKFCLSFTRELLLLHFNVLRLSSCVHRYWKMRMWSTGQKLNHVI